MEPELCLEYARKTMWAYEEETKPLCAEVGIPHTAFDILMFIANNPAVDTAKDVVERKRLKANLVSINVEKLVKEGYLERSADEEDRRKVILSCTAKAAPVIQKGREVQKRFYDRLIKDVPPESIMIMRAAIRQISRNIDGMWSDRQ